MKHHELLDKIYWYWRRDNCGADGLQPMVDYRRALLAVVDLHKPDLKGGCNTCSWIVNGFVLYEVCPTIQAIQKELK